jgi:hypothetical protein
MYYLPLDNFNNEYLLDFNYEDLEWHGRYFCFYWDAELFIWLRIFASSFSYLS